MKKYQQVVLNLDMAIYKRKAPVYVSSIKMVPLVFKAVRRAKITGGISLTVLKAIWSEYVFFLQGRIPRQYMELI